jgi:hypothetical protein
MPKNNNADIREVLSCLYEDVITYLSVDFMEHQKWRTKTKFSSGISSK